MIVRKLDADHDFTFGKGLANYARDEAAIEQNVGCNLLTWQGECFFDLDAGLDWVSRLDTGQQAALIEEAKQIILQSFGVVGVGVVSSSFDGKTRRMQLAYSMDTIFGQNFKNGILQPVGA